jgi:hypothetical protein
VPTGELCSLLPMTFPRPIFPTDSFAPAGAKVRCCLTQARALDKNSCDPRTVVQGQACNLQFERADDSETIPTLIFQPIVATRRVEFPRPRPSDKTTGLLSRYPR